MRSTKLIRTLTLTGFVLLLTGFVAYRTGALKKLFSEDKNSVIANYSGWEPVNPADTPTVGPRKNSPAIMSSSKSMALPQERITFPPNVKDSTKKNATTKTDSAAQKPLKKKAMMGGSKSAYIYKPETDSTESSPEK